MEFTRFGDLLGIYHPATGDRRGESAVLICPPIAHEHIRAHRALRFLAVRLAREGFDVLRFDYFGVGDSAGESDQATVVRWRADVVAAATELQALSGSRALAIVGVRFGATLAATASLPAFDHFVMWDPVLCGRRYLAQLARTHQAMLSDPRCFSRPRHEYVGPDLVGFPYPPELRTQIAGCDLLAIERWPSRRVTVVQSSPAPDVEAFIEALRRHATAATWQRALTVLDWSDADGVGRSLSAGDVQATIVQVLHEAPP